MSDSKAANALTDVVGETILKKMADANRRALEFQSMLDMNISNKLIAKCMHTAITSMIIYVKIAENSTAGTNAPLPEDIRQKQLETFLAAVTSQYNEYLSKADDSSSPLGGLISATQKMWTVEE